VKYDTLQQVFNTVVEGLAGQQWQQSVVADSGSGTVCAYRGLEGRKCAAGHLITDEHYDANFERTGVSDVRVWRALVKSGVPNKLMPQVAELQGLHDGFCDNMRMRDNFAKYAERHDLVWPKGIE
jgi:hypothetical protein